MKNIKEKVEQPESNKFGELIFKEVYEQIPVKNQQCIFELINGETIKGELNIIGFATVHNYLEKIEPKILNLTNVCAIGRVSIPSITLYTNKIVYISELSLSKTFRRLNDKHGEA